MAAGRRYRAVIGGHTSTTPRDVTEACGWWPPRDVGEPPTWRPDAMLGTSQWPAALIPHLHRPPAFAQLPRTWTRDALTFQADDVAWTDRWSSGSLMDT
jgi:hypothetical protein